MNMPTDNPFNTRRRLSTGEAFYSLPALREAGFRGLCRMPQSLRIVLESLLRHCDGRGVSPEDVGRLARWDAARPGSFEIPFTVARVVLQDFTGVPLLVDLAAMRSAVKRLGRDPRVVEPLVPVDLVVDHSIQVDFAGASDALCKNLELEFLRNRERYQFLKWGMSAFDTFKVVPPGVGIVHQVNLECLARGVFERGGVVFPDSLVGTDSHTTMVNGLGIVGWGVGGIEAEAAMLGQPVTFLVPEVVGVHLTGRLGAGVTATDLVLRVTELLRAAKVVGKFVEFYGPGASALGVPDRATLANMAPEYGATMGFFGVDAATVAYLRATGRDARQCRLVEDYFKAQGLWGIPLEPDALDFSQTLPLDLSGVVPAVSGPRRPQDRIELAALKSRWRGELADALGGGNAGAVRGALQHGDVVIAAITSCTNTSNPSVMIAAGLLARNANARGLRVPAAVKTSLGPGSRVVTAYLEKTGLQGELDKLGFHTVGYGCTTCIGNSGPLAPEIEEAIRSDDLVVASVLSGNRNFEARVHPSVRANFLMSPPLVVAFALAGTVDIDFANEPLGVASDGAPVFLRELWPEPRELEAFARAAFEPGLYRELYADFASKNPRWNGVSAPTGEVFPWDADSTYVQEPPFFEGYSPAPRDMAPISAARPLAIFGDSITTDHISPAGSIKRGTPAARYLDAHGVAPADYNSYGSRRGNDRVMTRGTFANVRIRNLMVPGVEGGLTRHYPDGAQMAVFDAAGHYRAEGVPLIVIAGEDYGMGSSRDWAAKGTALLGVRAVIAKSFERIHRSNLAGMGVLPLTFCDKADYDRVAGLGDAVFDILGLSNDFRPRQNAVLRVHPAGSGAVFEVALCVRIDTPVEVDYYRSGGILPYVLGKVLGQSDRGEPPADAT
ncbi:MAG: aconitate hydratase AcnA [Puniceicoccales bacterium]|jgi:aconitate hydratase|nr:aconitate hydratase AcnA [Puniceicoccales bacterium]